MKLIVAIDGRGGIGIGNTLPWSIKEDMAHFKELTMGKVVIMGRKTYESIGKPLEGRTNVVITSYGRGIEQGHTNLITLPSLRHACDTFGCTNPFIIGGESIYRQALELDAEGYIHIEEYYITYVYDIFPECTTFFPLKLFSHKEMYLRSLTHISDIVSFATYISTRELESPHHVHLDEYQYLDTARHILANGCVGHNRTGIDTRSIIGNTTRWNLRNGTLPLLTTKRVFLRGVVEELLWILRGDTNAKLLAEKGVNIWNGNTSREALDKLGLSYADGEGGPIYGWQLRRYGATYGTNERGFDQLEWVVNEIKTNPSSRRILFDLWNPVDIDKMALPPCHYSYQFFVRDNELSLMMTMRSSDHFLGLPFNIASCAILTHLLAAVCDLKPGELIINTGDTHIYENHIEGIQKQFTRTLFVPPRLRINAPLHSISDIERLQFSDFEVLGYISGDAIKGEMAV